MSALPLLGGKVCIVTGGSRGIGAAVVKAFLEEGATVVATASRGSAREPSERERLSWLYFDVSDAVQVREAISGVRRNFGRIDVLVNNAGVEFNELLGMSSEEHMRRMFEVNAYGTILMAQYASRVMMRQETGGSIVNVSSGVGLRGNAGQSVYAATKGAVVAFTRSAAKELAASGIRVNSVAPGLTDTGMLDAASKEALERRLGAIALSRPAMPREIADACAYLASDKSSYVTGHTLVVDGCASI